MSIVDHVSDTLGPGWVREDQEHDGRPLTVWRTSHEHGLRLEWDGGRLALYVAGRREPEQVLTSTSVTQIVAWLVIVGLDARVVVAL